MSRAQADLEFFLGAGGARIERSTFGALLERVAIMAVDSEGRAHRRPRGETMKVQHTPGEPGYDLDFSTIARLGRALRLLDAVGARSRILRRALEAYHGDRGVRWGREPDRENASGVGDRSVAVWPLTAYGRDWIAALREVSPLSGELQDDEVLANELVAYRRDRGKDEKRAMRVRLCREEARVLIEAAHEALEVAAAEHDATKKAIRRAALRRVGESERRAA